MAWFGRRRKEAQLPEPELPGVWVWRRCPAIGGSSITRFFFKGGMLDLPEMIGPGADRLEAPFKEIPHVMGARFHQTYMAVQWWNTASEEDVERIVQLGVALLKDHFKWDEMRYGEVYSNNALEKLRHEEAVESDVWMIGRG